MGISQSKTGLTSDRLTKRNKLVSSVCSQCIGVNVAESGRLKTQLRAGRFMSAAAVVEPAAFYGL
jgi:hypothetical protein